MLSVLKIPFRVFSSVVSPAANLRQERSFLIPNTKA
jgi:hypothetical protein